MGLPKTNDVPVFESGNYFPAIAAEYLCEISSCKLKQNRKKKERFIVELEVLESNCSDVPVGMTMSWVVDTEDEDFAPRDLRGFALAALGFKKSDPNAAKADTDGALAMAVGEDQVFAETKVRVITKCHTTEVGGKFTRINFEPAPEGK